MGNFTDRVVVTAFLFWVIYFAISNHFHNADFCQVATDHGYPLRSPTDFELIMKFKALFLILYKDHLLLYRQSRLVDKIRSKWHIVDSLKMNKLNMTILNILNEGFFPLIYPKILPLEKDLLFSWTSKVRKQIFFRYVIFLLFTWKQSNCKGTHKF